MDREKLNDCIETEERKIKRDANYLSLYKEVARLSTEDIITNFLNKGDKIIFIKGEKVIELTTELLIRLLIDVSKIKERLKIE